MTLDPAFWELVLKVVHAIMTGAVGIYVWLMKRAQISADRFRELEQNIGARLEERDRQLHDMGQNLGDRLDEQDRRLSRVETACGYAPTHSDLGKMYKQMNDISGQVKQLSGGVEALRESVGLIHEHLLNRGGGR